MKRVTFIQILKPLGNAIGKMQTGEGRGASRLMQCYRTREGETLLSYRPCTVNKSEVNAAGKLDTRRNREKELLTTMTCLRLECQVRLWWVFSILFYSNLGSHNNRGADWLLWHSKLMTLYTMSYQIKYTVARLSCVHSKIQQLCLICYALDLRRYLLRWTPRCMVLASSTNFIEDY